MLYNIFWLKSVMVTLSKTLGISILVLLYILTSQFIRLTSRDSRRRRRRLVKNTSRFSRMALALLRIRVVVRRGGLLARNRAARLIVANHVSSADILILSSIAPSVFVTSVELGNAFFVGMMARCGGSIFVERRRVTGLKKEIEEIEGAIKDGLDVMLFPEGTTSDGGGVRPFKNSLFDAAIKSGADVLPICIRYKSVNGRKIDSSNRDSIYFYGGISFFAHALRLLSNNEVDVDVLVLAPVKTADRYSRKELAAVCHKEICSAYLS